MSEILSKEEAERDRKELTDWRATNQPPFPEKGPMRGIVNGAAGCLATIEALAWMLRYGDRCDIYVPTRKEKTEYEDRRAILHNKGWL